mgnify:FL=1
MRNRWWSALKYQMAGCILQTSVGDRWDPARARFHSELGSCLGSLSFGAVFTSGYSLALSTRRAGGHALSACSFICPRLRP